MNRWSRSRELPPVSVRLADIARRLGIGLPAGADVDTIIAALDLAADRVRIAPGNPGNDVLEVFHRAIEAAPVALVLLDCEGRELARSNAATEWLRGGAAAAISAPVLGELVRKASHGGETRHDVIETFGPPRRTLSLMAVPLASPRPFERGHDQPAPVLVFIEDTTEWRRAELARRDFVTNISHELRTPVGAIALLAETIATEDDPDTVSRLAGRLESEANRLATTLQDVLSLSRLEAAGPGDREPMNISELLRFCVSRVRARADLAGIVLRDTGIEPDLVAVADRALLTTAFDNLLDNAVKYSDKAEPVDVLARRVQHGDQNHVEIVVRDHGVGIPLRERQRIFERFYRVDRARSRDTGGSGLGLAIVRHVAVVHDGTIDVDSLEGAGSTFTLRLPLVAQVSA